MRSKRMRVFAAGIAAAVIGICAESAFSEDSRPKNNGVGVAVGKGIRWLVSVQGQDGGWGQDGGVESGGNDVANTVVAAEALLRAGNTPTSGPQRESLVRAIRFILQNVEQSPTEGLAVTTRQGTQIQHKLGPYIDTFLTSKLLAELDGNMGDAAANARVRKSLQKCVAKIESNQLKDGSWNLAGGWAPILGTSMASQSLYAARSKGVAVAPKTLASVDQYTKRSSAAQVGSGSGGGVGAGVGGGVASSARLTASPMAAEASASSAGVSLYKKAQELEQLSRTDEDRKTNAREIGAIRAQLSDSSFVTGYGSMGGEEFFSYLNISDSLRRTGGREWQTWHGNISEKILKMQNEDGTWAGHHCITGRVAVTSAAILNLLADREPALVTNTSAKKK